MEGEKLNTNFYSQVAQRMATEEATCVLSNTDAADMGWVWGWEAEACLNVVTSKCNFIPQNYTLIFAWFHSTGIECDENKESKYLGSNPIL